MTAKTRSIALICLAEVLAMSLWFISAAILPQITMEAGLSPARGAALSTAVQIGFVLGALGFAVLGVADRLDPRRVLCASALLGAAANAALLITPLGSDVQVLLRLITGVALAGVYPVGMKIVIGWGLRDRGLLVALLVSALTVGSASPHLLVLMGGADWRVTVLTASLFAAGAGILALFSALGPHHARAARFDWRSIGIAWTNRRVRLAYAGYLGHMWELYAFWAWCAVIATASFATLGEAAEQAGRLLAFAAISLGGLACIPAGRLADRIGKARVARGAMIGSALAGIGSVLSFGGAIWLSALFLLMWGITIIPDSAQFSALVADAAPPDIAGSLMTLQTALGFALTAITVQVTPMLASAIGWQATLALMVFGPLFGIAAMQRLIGMGRPTDA